MIFFFFLPGIAGHAGTEQRVPDGDENKVLMEPAVHPAVGHHVVPITDGTTCRRTAPGQSSAANGTLTHFMKIFLRL